MASDPFAQRRLRKSLLLSMLSVVILHGATETEELLDRSRALPPEFAADSLLRIAVDNKLAPSRVERIDIVEEAFRLAAHAQMAWPLRGRGFHTDTRPGWKEFASDTGLNSLALQVRALEQMQSLDRGRLRRMFSDMRPIQVEPGSCKQPQRPALESYYRAMLVVAQHGFDAKAISEGEPERWLAENLRSIRSPSQISGATRAIQKPSDTLLNAIASALPNVHHDWLDFVYADGDLPLALQTAGSVRDYLVRTLQGSRCSGRYQMRTVGDVPLPVERFNAFAKGHPELQLEPIDHTKLEPASIKDEYRLEEFWTSAKSKEVLEGLRWLNHGNRNLPDSKRFWTLQERQSQEWNERYLGLLKLMEGWTADDEPSAADYFHMRAHTFATLTRLTPPGAQRTNAFRNLISFLNASYNDRIPHAEWFTHVSQLIRENRAEPWLLDELELNGNTVLSHYARLAKRGLFTR